MYARRGSGSNARMLRCGACAVCCRRTALRRLLEMGRHHRVMVEGRKIQREGLALQALQMVTAVLLMWHRARAQVLMLRATRRREGLRRATMEIAWSLWRQGRLMRACSRGRMATPAALARVL